ncbi:MAG: peptidylprolyl isomerase [Flavobacteriales bacterium]|nr:peptidylprolyl isomerase [Flavobacteriales bacterium]
MKPSRTRAWSNTERLLGLLLLLVAPPLAAQPTALVVDRVVAVVGREAILYSELVVRAEQNKQHSASTDPHALQCEALEDVLYEKLLLEQAKLDSVEVDEGQVNAELDRRIRYFVGQLGSERKLEEFYGKTIAEIKSDFKTQVKDQLQVQQMQQKITSDVSITPREVKRFYEQIPSDSVPFISAEVEYAMVLRVPKPSEEEDRRVRRKIEEYREAVVNNTKDFCTVAILYSEDPGSAKECGELGMVPPGVMVPEFDAVAASLKEGEVSQVFKTQYGWHFMQLIERRGEQYNARHVLMRPQVASVDLQRARNLLDSLRAEVLAGRLSFEKAATDFSDDEESRGQNGMMIEPNDNSTRWAIGDLDQQTFFVLDKLKAGEVSEPQLTVLPDATKAYRLLKLISRSEPHKANLKDDYRLLQQAAEGKSRSEIIDRWIDTHIGSTYVRVDEDYSTCTFQHPWVAPRDGQ